jgi:hypothetical protein
VTDVLGYDEIIGAACQAYHNLRVVDHDNEADRANDLTGVSGSNSRNSPFVGRQVRWSINLGDARAREHVALMVLCDRYSSNLRERLLALSVLLTLGGREGIRASSKEKFY